MNRVALTLMAMLLIVSIASSQGTMAKSGQWGVQTSIGLSSSPILSTATIGAKFMASDNLAIRVEAGFASSTPPSPPTGSSSATTGYGFGGGFEYHMDSKGGSVSPYVGLEAGYGGGSTPSPSTGTAPPTPALFGVEGVVGGEYFFSSNFSWGGEIGVGFQSLSNQFAGVDASG